MFILIFMLLLIFVIACDFLLCPETYILDLFNHINWTMLINAFFEVLLSSCDFSSSFLKVNLLSYCTRLTSILNFTFSSKYFYLSLPNYFLKLSNRLCLWYIESHWDLFTKFFILNFKNILIWGSSLCNISISLFIEIPSHHKVVESLMVLNSQL